MGKKKSSGQLEMFPTETVKPPIDVSLLKSAIQKAYRRNHKTLFDFCFSSLWDSGLENQKWLIWRSPIFAAEEGLQTLAGMGRVIRNVKSITSSKNPIAWLNAKALLYEELVRQMGKEKNQDANGMKLCAKMVALKDGRDRQKLQAAILNKMANPLYESSFTKMVEVCSSVEKDNIIRPEWWNEVWNRVDTLGKRGEELGKDEAAYKNLRDQVGAAYFRAKEGGMIGDRAMLLCNAFLSMDDYEFKLYGGFTDLPTTTVALIEDDFGPDTTKVPWYCCDGHTGLGKRMLAYLMKKYPYSKDALHLPMFVYEGARVNAIHSSSVWWDLARRVVPLAFGYNLEQWQGGIWPDIRQTWKTKVEKWMNEE